MGSSIYYITCRGGGGEELMLCNDLLQGEGEGVSNFVTQQLLDIKNIA